MQTSTSSSPLQILQRLQDDFPYVNMSYCKLTSAFHPKTCWHHKDGVEFVIQVSVITAIVTIGLVGNFLLGSVICLSPRLRPKSINLFILNLCIANFFNLLLVAPSQVANGLTEFYPLPQFACKTVSMLQIIFFIVPMLTLVVISLDRLLAIKYPFRDTAYTWKALLGCLMVWIIGIGVSIDKYFMRQFSLVHYQDFDLTMCGDEYHYTYEEEEEKKVWLRERIYWFSVVILSFLLPFFGMFSFYVGILLRIKYIAKKITTNDTIHNRNVLTVAVMVIVVIISTLICWMPMVIYWFQKYSKNEVHKQSYPRRKPELIPLYIVAQFFIFSHCALQPIIYFATGSKLRKEARNIFLFTRNVKVDFPGMKALLNHHARMMDLSVQWTIHNTEAEDNSTDELESGPEDVTSPNPPCFNNNHNNNSHSPPSSAKFAQISLLSLPTLDRKLSTRSLGIADLPQIITEFQKQERKLQDNRKIEEKQGRKMDDEQDRKVEDLQVKKIYDTTTLSDKVEGRLKKTSLIQMDIDPGDTPSGSPETRRKRRVSFFNVIPGVN